GQGSAPREVRSGPCGDGALPRPREAQLGLAVACRSPLRVEASAVIEKCPRSHVRGFCPAFPRVLLCPLWLRFYRRQAPIDLASARALEYSRGDGHRLIERTVGLDRL